MVVASLGTSATLFSPSGTAVWDVTGTVAPFCDATGQWLPLICTQNCSQPAEEVCCHLVLPRPRPRPLLKRPPPLQHVQAVAPGGGDPDVWRLPGPRRFWNEPTAAH